MEGFSVSVIFLNEIRNFIVAICPGESIVGFALNYSAIGSLLLARKPGDEANPVIATAISDSSAVQGDRQ